MTKPYWQKLQDPRWQKKRLEIMERAGFKCEACGSSEKTLHVHHSYYEKGLEPWEYPDRSLHCLCAEDHESRAVFERALLRACWEYKIEQLQLLGNAIYAHTAELGCCPDDAAIAIEHLVCAKVDELTDEYLKAFK